LPGSKVAEVVRAQTGQQRQADVGRRGAVRDGGLRPDDNVVFVGFGGGLTWAASVVKWDVTPPQVSLPRREWRRARYIVARTRSKLKKWRRKIIDAVAGSPTPNARMRDADKK